MRRSNKTSHADSKDFIERLLQIATIASILIGLPVAFIESRPVSTIVLSIAGLLLLSALVVYLWRKRLPSGDRKYNGKRWFVTGLASFVVLGSMTAIAIPPSRSFFVYNVLGFQAPLTAGSLEPAFSPEYTRIVLPINNTQTSDQEVTQMTLYVESGWRNDGKCGSGPEFYILRLRNTIIVNRATKGAKSGVEIRSGIAAGLETAATGSYSTAGTCNARVSRVTLTFATPGLLLQKSATTIIAIDIPSRIQLISSKGKPIAGYSNIPLPTSIYSDPDNYATFRLTVETTGATLTSCLPRSCPDEPDWALLEG